jgi:hypothetical protein
MSLKIIFLVLLTLVSLQELALAQHKGISFQAVLKKPDGTYPNVSGLAVTLQILDPVSDCVLREEIHSGVNISNGYINLVLGSATATTPTGKNPATVLTIPQVFDNSTPRTGLNCVDMNDTITATNQTYTPLSSHARKLRLRAVVAGDTIVADFSMRAIGYAVNAENLDGKGASAFVQTSAATTQANVESVFTRYATLDAILNGTFAGNAATATSLATAPGACPAGQYMNAMTASGAITCGTPAAGSVTNVTSANSYLSVATGTSTPVLTVNVGTVANTVAAGNDARFTDSRAPNGAAGGDLSGTYPNPSVAKVAGKTVTLTTPAAGDLLTYDGTKFVNSPPATAVDATKLPLAGGTMSGAIDMSSQNLTNVGFVTMSANKNLHLSNNASDPVGLVAADKGKMWFNSTSGVIKYWDGSAAQPLGVAGSGLSNFNTQTGTTQTLAIGTSGTAPGWNSASNVHTLNIPMASTASVTAGLLSKTDYDAFTAKLDSSSAFAGDVTGTAAATSVDKIKGKAVTPAAYAAGQTLRYDGTQWINAVLGFADLGSKPTTLAGYGITDAQSSTLADGKILVGNASNVATAVTMSGDATLSNAGALTLATVPISKGGTGVTSFTGDRVITTSAAGALQATSCGLGQVISFTAGGAITCATPAAGSVTSVTSANSYLSVATGTSTPVLTVNVGTAANTVAAGDDARFTDSRAPNGTAGGDLSGTYPNPSVAKVSGKAVTLTSPTAGDVLTYDGTGFVNSPAAADATKLPLAGGTMSGAIDMGSQNLTSTGFITMSANKNLHLSNNASDPAGLVAADKGKMWFNSTTGEIKFWNGSSAQSLGVAGSGLANFNTQTGTTQTLAIGTSGTAPGWNSASNVHTLNIPMASTASVTAGLLSKTDYDAFTAKLDSTATFAGDVSGTYGATSVDKIKGKTVSPAAYAAGQTLRYDGTNWVNSVLAFADLGSKPTTLAGYGITDAQSTTLADGKILVGNASNVATAVSMSGDATLSNAGALTLATVPISKGGTGQTSFAGDKVITTSAAGALQATSCALGQVISFTAGGAITCATPAAGSVTSVTSANSYLSVATGTSTPVLTVNVGTVANTVAAGDDARFTDSRAPNGSAGGDLSGTYPNPTVAKISGKAVTPAAYTAGQTLRYDGTQWVNSVLAFADLGSKPTTLAGYGITDAQSSTLADGKIFVGNSSNVATAVTMSGDATLADTGALTLATVPISKGGTGQITKTAAFDALSPLTTKGDLIVRDASNNVRLPAGTDTYVLTADSTQASGLKWAAPSSSGITSLGGLTASTQTFAIGTSGTAPAFSSATSTHTLNIPMASTASVTAGLISKTDYDAFNTKLGTSTAFSGDVSGAYNATSVDKIKGKAVTPTTYAAGQTLRYDGTQWINAVLAFADLGSKPTTLAGYGITDAQSSSLTDGKILVGNSSNVATAVTMSGDATLADTGALTLATVPISKGGTGVTSFASDKVITTSAAGALQATSCALGQVISFTAGGAITCATPAGGSVTSVTSANSYLSVATGTTTPVLTLNVGTAANTVAAGNDARFTDSRAPNGTAGGDLSGTYPNPTVAKISGKAVTPTTYAAGQTLRYDGTQWVNSVLAFADLGSTPTTLAGYGITDAQSTTLTNGKILVGNTSNVATAVTMSGDATLSNAGALTLATVPVSKGGTGQTTKTAAFDALAPNTTKGDVTVFNGTNNVRLPAGTDTYVLTADSTQASGLKWAAPSSSGITSLGGLTASTQTFAIGTSGTAPAFSSATSTHTLNIPMASTASVTAGLISKTDYDAFNTKLGTSTAFSGDVSGAYNATSVDKIKGKTVSPAAYSAGQTLRYDGTNWVNAVLAFADLGSKPTTVAGYGITDAMSTTLASGKIFVGNGSSVATAVSMSGDATLSNTGALTLGTVPISKGGTGLTSFAGDKLVTTSTGGAIQTSSCALNQVISFTAGGAITCMDVSSLVTGFVNGGNSFGAAANLGTNDAFDLNIKTNNTTRMTVLSGGNVGIGTTTPGSNLTVNETTTVTSGQEQTFNVVSTISPASASTAYFIPSYIQATSGGTNKNITGFEATISEADWNESTATLASGYGTESLVKNTAAGVVTSGYGTVGHVDNTAGGSIGTAVGVRGYVANSGAGTTTSAYGGMFSVTQNAGAITTAFGVNIGTIQGTSKWSLYSSDATAPSYFAGNVGIGTTSATEKLSVSGNARVLGQATAQQNVVATGATVDFNNGNVQVLQAPGGSAITLNNMVDGGAYTLIVTDATSRTYTFTNCTNSRFQPTNAATTASKHTIYTILKVTVSSATWCYINWSSDY